MNRRLFLVSVLVSALLPASAPSESRAAADGPERAAFAIRASAPKAPWFGVWQLNPMKSTRRSDPSPYKKVTLRIEPWEDGLKVTYDMVGTRGGVTHMEWIGRFDGRDYAVRGVDYVLTNAYRLIDDRSYEIVVKVDGQLAATAIAVVSPDGATLSVATAERDARGQTVNTTAVYRKLPSL
jgi:hypothetical protein